LKSSFHELFNDIGYQLKKVQYHYIQHFYNWPWLGLEVAFDITHRPWCICYVIQEA